MRCSRTGDAALARRGGPCKIHRAAGGVRYGVGGPVMQTRHSVVHTARGIRHALEVTDLDEATRAPEQRQQPNKLPRSAHTAWHLAAARRPIPTYGRFPHTPIPTYGRFPQTPIPEPPGGDFGRFRT